MNPRLYPSNDHPSRRSGRATGSRNGFTLIEMLVVMAILIVCAVLLLPVVGRARRASQSVACLSHLRHLGMAFRMYAQDNFNQLPNPGLTGIPWERSLFHYTAPGTFVCPGDSELAPATNSSYDWRDTGIASTTLAGRGLDLPRRNAVLVYDSLPDWHQRSQMNVCFVDGSVQSMDQSDLVIDLDKDVILSQ